MHRTLGLLLLLGLTACAHRPRVDYLKSLEGHTELLEVYWGFGTALRVRATLLSPGMRSAMIHEELRLVGGGDDYRNKLQELHTSDAQDFYEVIFTAESDMERSTTFGRGSDDWQVTLWADGEEMPLVEVYRVRRPTSTQQNLYAHKNIWNQLWVARFERRVQTPTEVSFQVGSGWGHKRATWAGDQLDDTPTPNKPRRGRHARP